MGLCLGLCNTYWHERLLVAGKIVSPKVWLCRKGKTLHSKLKKTAML